MNDPTITKPKRVPMSKKLRFEVFKRDGFKCMYCGAEAPQAVLNVDHIKPVAKGGTNDLLNLVSSCAGCNAGKSDRELSDDSAVKKQRIQLDDLHARREQMEMMLAWRDGLSDLNAEKVAHVQAHFSKVMPGWSLASEVVLKQVRLFLKNYGLMSVLDAIDTAAERYLKPDAEGRITGEQAHNVWEKAGGILFIGNKSADQQRLHYVKGILNNRFNYLPFTVMRELEAGLAAGIDVEDMVEEAKSTRSWSQFSYWLGNEC